MTVESRTQTGPGTPPRDFACVSRILSDEPSNTDAFGAHEEVAAAIARLVESAPGRKAIGLSGSYGAGKSTTINLIRQTLESDLTTVWVFDAWAHEGDPLRRTFLESLIGQLMERGWLDRSRWSDRIEHLARRRREWTTRTTPTVTPFGWGVLVSLLLVPLGTTLLASALRDGFSLLRWEGGRVVWSAALGIPLTIGPILLLCARMLRHRFGSGRKNASVATAELGDVFALLLQKNVSEQSTSVIETPEPTSIEFEKAFRELAAEAIGMTAGRKLVIVVDNLDRVAPTEAMKIWSTLQTFLTDGGPAERWRDRVWVIMPFDEEAIRRIWEAATSGTKNPDAGAHATAYLEKTFQVRFEVPPPLLSDWKKYARARLAEALPGHDKPHEDGAELDYAVEVYALHRGPDQELPTPRDLKVFVNQVGALHMQARNHDIPLRQQAFYVLKRRKLSVAQIVAKLRENTLFVAPDSALLGESARLNLAALAFGAPPPRARQLLLEEPIMRALAVGDSTTLRSLQGEGFVDVVQSGLTEWLAQWRDSRGAALFHAFAALADANVLEQGTSGGRQLLLRSFKDAMRDATRFDLWNDTGANGAAQLATMSDPATRKGIVSALQMMIDLRGDLAALGAAASVIRDVTIVLASIPEEERAEATLGTVRIESPGSYLAVVNELHANGEPITVAPWRQIVPVDANEVVALLARHAEEGRLSASHIAAVGALRRQSTDIALAKLFEGVVLRFESGGPFDSAELIALLAVLDLCAADSAANSERIKIMVDAGYAANAYVNVSGADVDDARARLVLRYIAHRPGMSAPASVLRSDEGYALMREAATNPTAAFVRHVAQLAHLAGSDGLILDLDETVEFLPLVRGCIREWSGLENPGSVMSAQVLWKSWDVVASALDDPMPMLRRSGAVEGLLEILAATPLRVAREALYRHVLALSADIREMREARGQVIEHALVHLKGTSQGIWKRELASDTIGDLLRFARMLRDFAETDLGPNFRAALVEYARSLVGGASAGLGTNAAMSWDAILQLLSEGDEVTVRDQVANLLKEKDAAPSEVFFRAFGGVVWRAELLAEGRAGVTTVLVPLVERRTLPAAKWLRDMLVKHPSWVAKLSEAHRDALRSSVAHVCKDELADEELRQVLLAAAVPLERATDDHDGTANQAG